jgi:hypothetical protein
MIHYDLEFLNFVYIGKNSMSFPLIRSVEAQRFSTYR